MRAAVRRLVQRLAGSKPDFGMPVLASTDYCTRQQDQERPQERHCHCRALGGTLQGKQCSAGRAPGNVGSDGPVR